MKCLVTESNILFVLFQRHHPAIYKAVTAKPDPKEQLPMTQFVNYKPTKWTPYHPPQQYIMSVIVIFVAEDLQALSVIEALPQDVSQ